MKVCEKVKKKGTTSYNEVADELVGEFTNPAHINSLTDQVFLCACVYMCVFIYKYILFMYFLIFFDELKSSFRLWQYRKRTYSSLSFSLSRSQSSNF